VQAGEYLKRLSLSVTASKLKSYVDADMAEAVRAAIGDDEPRPSRAGTGDSVTVSSDAEEIPEDESFLTSAVASRRPPTPSVF